MHARVGDTIGQGSSGIVDALHFIALAYHVELSTNRSSIVAKDSMLASSFPEDAAPLKRQE